MSRSDTVRLSNPSAARDSASPLNQKPLAERDLYLWGEGLFLLCGSLLVLVVIFVLTTEVTLVREGDPVRASLPSLFKRIEGALGR